MDQKDCQEFYSSVKESLARHSLARNTAIDAIGNILATGCETMQLPPTRNAVSITMSLKAHVHRQKVLLHMKH
jgi:hypothetical protein